MLENADFSRRDFADEQAEKKKKKTDQVKLIVGNWIEMIYSLWK